MSNQYFSKLNYTLANEDTTLELEILPERVQHLLSVAGSGGRVLPLLAKKPSHVTCVDVASEQLYLTEMRFESLRDLSHEDFLAFWGYPPRVATAQERKSLFEKLKLSTPAREYLSQYFSSRNWESILYDGKWEQTFAKLSQLNRLATGTRGAGLFHALQEKEYFEYLEKKFPKRAWLLVLAISGNATLFNALLYKGHFPKKNIPESFIEFYRDAFDRLFKQGLARKNFFLQLCFFGKIIFSEGCPIECDPEVFAQAKEGIQNAKVQYARGDLIETIQRSQIPCDFVSLSDVPSYFSGEREQNFMDVIAENVSVGGFVVLRNYLHIPEKLNTSKFETVTAQYQSWIDREKVQMYKIDIFKRRER